MPESKRDEGNYVLTVKGNADCEYPKRGDLAKTRMKGANQSSSSASLALARPMEAAINTNQVRLGPGSSKGDDRAAERPKETWQVSGGHADAEGTQSAADSMKKKPKGRSPEPEAPPATAGSAAGGEGEIHEELPPYEEEEEEPPPPYQAERPSPAAVLVSSSTMKKAILPTFQAKFKNPKSKATYMGRALADSGGQTSLITQELVDRLKLKTAESEIRLTYAEGKVSEEPLAETKLTMISPKDPKKIKTIRAYVVPTIACELQGFKGSPLETFPSMKSRNRPLADKFTNNGKINVDVLIGNDHYWDLGLTAPIKPKEQNSKELRFQDSDFGLIMSGAVKQEKGSKSRAMYMMVDHTELRIPQSRPLPKKAQKVDLDEYLRRMVELDTVGIVLPRETTLSAKEERAVRYLNENRVFRKDLKRFEVKIPFDDTKGPLVNNYHQAKSRLDSLLSQLERDDVKRPMYIEKMKSYLDKNHASLITAADEKAKDIYYLPHSGVLEPKPDGKGWKLRVVFDGSAKDRNGLSPNSWMIQGPVPDVTILRTLVKWRENPIAISMDVKDCFLMIMLHPDQQNMFRFLWKEPGETEVKTYKFTSLIFGSATSPWISSTCLDVVLEELKEKHPKLVRQVRQNLYVDDLLLSFETVEEGKKAIATLQKAFKEKSFGLAKFKANDDAVLADLEDEQLLFDRNSAEDEMSKALGVAWRRRADLLSIAEEYQANFKDKGKPETKRSLARKVASVYDPLNMVAPWRIGGQILLSKAWDYHGELAEARGIAKNCKKLWDEPLPEDFQKEIKIWSEDYERITEVSINRCYIKNKPIKKRKLCGFSDASLLAFGAMVYMVTEYRDGDIEVAYICSRIKVNLAKPDEARRATDEKTKKKRGQTLPRAELMGAKFLAVLVHNIKNYLDIGEGEEDIETMYFTDSTTALCYLKSEPDRWKVFVANAVKMIQQVSSIKDWYHVPGLDNPADLLTRPMQVKEFLEKLDFWREGPAFLKTGKLPIQPDTEKETEEMKEEAKAEKPLPSTVIMVNSIKDDEHFMRKLAQRYGDLHKAIKYAAIIARFARYTWNKLKPNHKALKEYEGPVLANQDELRSIMDIIAALAQKEEFREEIKLIKAGKPLANGNKLARLDPVIEDGLLKVRARLDTSDSLNHLPSEWKRPIIIPNKNDLVKRTIMLVHEMARHAGAALVRSLLRKRWWILSDQRTVKDVVESCYYCRTYQAKTMQQKMGPLPASRLAYMQPCFTHIALDAMGPLHVYENFKRPTLTKKQLKERRKAAEQGLQYEELPTSKVWVLVIGCQTTRAVNLVILDNLSTEAFCDAMRRHSAEHGLPKTVRLDNFRAHLAMSAEVDNLLAKSFAFDLQRQNERRGIRWSWSAPLAPSTNGVIERLVRTTKEALRKSIHRNNLYYAELTTLLAEAKHTINSRPLVAQTRSDSSEPDAITPHHLLYGHQLAALPFAHGPEDDKKPDLPEQRWEQRQKRAKMFSAQFMESYLREIRLMRKGKQEKDPIQEGDIVLVTIPLEKRRDWPIALVTKLIYGRDGLVRLCEVRMKNGTFQRAVTSLVKLRSVAHGGQQQQEQAEPPGADGGRPEQELEEDDDGGERQSERKDSLTPSAGEDDQGQGGQQQAPPDRAIQPTGQNECISKRRSARLAAKPRKTFHR